MGKSVEQFQARKKQIERARRELHREEGQLENLESQLAEHDCQSLEEAKDLVEGLEAQLAEAQEALNSDLERFDRKWGRKLEEARGG